MVTLCLCCVVTEAVAVAADVLTDGCNPPLVANFVFFVAEPFNGAEHSKHRPDSLNVIFPHLGHLVRFLSISSNFSLQST